MRRLHPGPIVEIADDELADAYAFPDARSWIRVNFVSTLDGVIRGTDGTSRSIASPADQRAFSQLRRAADVVLVGAGTLRDEDYHPARLPLAVVTATGNLPVSLRLFTLRTADTPRTLVLTTKLGAASIDRAWLPVAEVIECGEDGVDLPTAMAALIDRGLRRIHCEGGPRLLGDLAAAGLLDELLLTVVPVLHGGGPAEHLLTVAGGLDPDLRLQVTQVLEEDGSVFIRASRA